MNRLTVSYKMSFPFVRCLDQSMRGIYLPVLREPRECHRRSISILHSTLAKGTGGHFSALIGTAVVETDLPRYFDIGSFHENLKMSTGRDNDYCGISQSPIKRSVEPYTALKMVREKSLIPLIDKTGDVLPIRFCTTARLLPLTEWNSSTLISKYLDIAWMPKAAHKCSFPDHGTNSCKVDANFFMYAVQNNLKLTGRAPYATTVTNNMTYQMPQTNIRLVKYFADVDAKITDRRKRLESEIAKLDDTQRYVRTTNKEMKRYTSNDNTLFVHPDTSTSLPISSDFFIDKRESVKYSSILITNPGNAYEASLFKTSQPSAVVAPLLIEKYFRHTTGNSNRTFSKTQTCGDERETGVRRATGINAATREIDGSTHLPVERFVLSSRNSRPHIDNTSPTDGFDALCERKPLPDQCYILGVEVASHRTGNNRCVYNGTSGGYGDSTRPTVSSSTRSVSTGRLASERRSSTKSRFSRTSIENRSYIASPRRTGNI